MGFFLGLWPNIPFNRIYLDLTNTRAYKLTLSHAYTLSHRHACEHWLHAHTYLFTLSKAKAFTYSNTKHIRAHRNRNVYKHTSHSDITHTYIHTCTCTWLVQLKLCAVLENIPMFIEFTDFFCAFGNPNPVIFGAFYLKIFWLMRQLLIRFYPSFFGKGVWH